MSKNPWYLGGPFIRPAVREALLSETGQNALTGPSQHVPPSALMALLYGGNGLLGQ
jgi:hypothetical protein